VNLPDNVLLLRITPKHLYLDKKSKEPSTDLIKRKYKLAGNMILDQYFFNILTRNSSTCKARLTLCIEPNDWENKTADSRLGNENSYCDLTEYELLNKADLLSKMKDRTNGFPLVAKLCDQKCRELENLRPEITKYSYISQETKNLIGQGTSPMVNAILSKLGLT